MGEKVMRSSFQFCVSDVGRISQQGDILDNCRYRTEENRQTCYSSFIKMFIYISEAIQNRPQPQVWDKVGLVRDWEHHFHSSTPYGQDKIVVILVKRKGQIKP